MAKTEYHFLVTTDGDYLVTPEGGRIIIPIRVLSAVPRYGARLLRPLVRPLVGRGNG
ncbi:MAG: hypothetical protein AAFP81_16865 [Pseudomonadota bacterium]